MPNHMHGGTFVQYKHQTKKKKQTKKKNTVYCKQYNNANLVFSYYTTLELGNYVFLWDCNTSMK